MVMRSARALLASLGAGTCLIIAGTLAMVFLSTVVAFSGLPGMRLDDGGAPPALLAAPAPPGGMQAPLSDRNPKTMALRPMTPPTAGPARPARPARGGDSFEVAPVPGAPVGGAVTSPPGARAPAGPAGGGTTPATPAPAPARPSSPAPAQAPVITPGPSPSPPRDSLQDVGRASGDALKGVVVSVGEALKPVSPPLGGVVVETGEVAGETVPAATEAVGALLDDLVGGSR